MKKAEIIVALDFPEKEKALSMIEKLDGVCDFFKIGMELGLRVDDGFLKELIASGKKIFLDYKYHDIGHTVEKAVANAAELGVYMMTVHAEKQVLAAAVKGKQGSNTKVFGVTVLTSLEQDYADQYRSHVDGSKLNINQLVTRRAMWAREAGADGVISSPQEIELIKSALPDLEVCTPGIRPTGYDRGDQKRIMTPAEAVNLGADYLVIGRPITKADNPRQVAQDILEEIQ